MRTPMRHLVIVSLCAGPLLWVVPALGLEDELLSLPDQQRASYYKGNAATVDELRATIEDTKRAAFERTAALQKLDVRFKEASLNTSLRLIHDESDEVSAAAARILASSITMMEGGDHDHADPLQAYWDNKENAAKTALRELAQGPDRPARTIAVQTLMSLSDPATITIVTEGVKQENYSDSDAVNLLGLAKPELAASSMLSFLDPSSSPAAQAAASSYLGTNKDYQSVVRKKIFENTQAPSMARVSAAKVLGQYDKEYAAYAPSVLNAQGTPKIVEKSVLEGLVRNSQIKGGNEAAVKKVFDQYKLKNPQVDIEVYTKRIAE
jgi:hypothetical protein